MHINIEGEQDEVILEIAAELLSIVKECQPKKKIVLCCPSLFFFNHYHDMLQPDKLGILADLDFYSYEKRVDDLIETDTYIVTTHYFRYSYPVYRKRDINPGVTVFVGNKSESILFGLFAQNINLFPVKYWISLQQSKSELVKEILYVLIEDSSLGIIKCLDDDKKQEEEETTIPLHTENV